jgi:hypothetical protein
VPVIKRLTLPDFGLTKHNIHGFDGLDEFLLQNSANACQLLDHTGAIAQRNPDRQDVDCG